MPNRLALETSLYLRQHQDQPVDWYAWGPEALEKAIALDRPILLSIGYSACHWCHVMAHESFDDPAIAAVMNEQFINIKVDREERPDLDAIYQHVAQIFTRGGGWPLTVFLTPELKPFFGGTYFPPQDAHGRVGFLRLITGLAEAFRNDRAKVEGHAHEIADMIREMEKLPQAVIEPSAVAELLAQTQQQLLSRLDPDWGGFGNAPKFPNPTLLQFLWRTQDPASCRAVVHTLTRIIGSGTFDQVGGGFHRYATDRRWLTPHFEKMLYDNALLAELLAEILSSSGHLESERELRRGLHETLLYLKRELWNERDGLFWSAQDADSEGHEGLFYTWTDSEIAALLTVSDRVLLEQWTDWRPGGNFESGRQILTLRKGIEPTHEADWKRIQDRLYGARSKRVWPARDEKSILAWNAMAISALAESAAVTDDPSDLVHKLKHALMSWEALREQMGFWPHSVPHASPEPAFLDDLALLARAYLKVASVDVGGATTYWQKSREVVQEIVDHAWDESVGACRYRLRGSNWVDSHPVHDQATPAGNATFFEVLSAHIASGEAPTAWIAVWEKMKARAPGWVQASAFGSGGFAACLSAIEAGGPWVVHGEVPYELKARGAVWRAKSVALDAHVGVQICVPGRCYSHGIHAPTA